MFENEDYLFWSLHGPVLQALTVTNMVKRWCRLVAKGSLWQSYVEKNVGVLAV